MNSNLVDAAAPVADHVLVRVSQAAEEGGERGTRHSRLEGVGGDPVGALARRRSRRSSPKRSEQRGN